MKSCKVLTIVSLVAVAAGLLATRAPAQEVTYTHATFTQSLDRIGNLEAQLASLQQQKDVKVSDACQSCGKGDCACSGGLYFGAAVVFIKPHFESAEGAKFIPTRGAATSITTSGMATSSTVQVPFNTQYDITPRLWLGWENCDGTGVRARYWRYDHDPLVFTTNLGPNQSASPPGPFFLGSSTLTSIHDTDVQALDVELTKRFEACGCWITGSGGLRYGKLNHNSSALGFDPRGTAALLLFAEGYEGLGPTFALEIGRPLFRRIGFYCSLRESVLFGQNNVAITDAFASGQQPPSVNTVNGSNDEALIISEVEVGFEWCADLRCGQLRARAGYEGQLWHSAGGPFNDDLDLGFEGGSFSLALHR